MARLRKIRMNVGDSNDAKKSAARLIAALDNSQVVFRFETPVKTASKLSVKKYSLEIRDVRACRPNYVPSATRALPHPTTCDPAPSSIRALPTIHVAHVRPACCPSHGA